MPEVVVVTGLGGMGLACARRLGNGRRMIFADIDARRVEAAILAFKACGFDVSGHVMDLADPAAARELAGIAAAAGDFKILMHTAGVSQTQVNDAGEIYRLNLLGCTRLIDVFGEQARAGSVGVVIASMGAQFVRLTQDAEQVFATGPVEALMDTVHSVPNYDDRNKAYLIAKRANQVRVEYQSLAWAERGARLVTISPGLISTEMGLRELAENPPVAVILAGTPMQRIGTPEDIANVVEWVTGPAASYVTGTDLRVDGGTIAALRWGVLGREMR